MSDPLLTVYSRMALTGYDAKRLSRAWQLVAYGQLEEKVLDYGTDEFSCDCPDFSIRSARDGPT